MIMILKWDWIDGLGRKYQGRVLLSAPSALVMITVMMIVVIVMTLVTSLMIF